MTFHELIKTATTNLVGAGIDSSRLDVLILLGDVTGQDRAALLTHPEYELNQEQASVLEGFIERRAKHEPLAYIRGKTEFYGREFIVNKDVLVPRPESEDFINILTSISKGQSFLEYQIADVGTGSGALGITAQLEFPETSVTLTDIDSAALSVAEQNGFMHGLELSYVKDDLLSHAKKRGAKIDIILANLPYVPNDYTINQAASHEPRLALFAGEDGLDLYRQLWKQISELSNKPQLVLTESLLQQHKPLSKLALSSGYVLKTTAGLVQHYSLVEY